MSFNLDDILSQYNVDVKPTNINTNTNNVLEYYMFDTESLLEAEHKKKTDFPKETDYNKAQRIFKSIKGGIEENKFSDTFPDTEIKEFKNKTERSLKTTLDNFNTYLSYI